MTWNYEPLKRQSRNEKVISDQSQSTAETDMGAKRERSGNTDSWGHLPSSRCAILRRLPQQECRIIADGESATAGLAGGMRKAPKRGRPVAADFRRIDRVHSIENSPNPGHKTSCFLARPPQVNGLTPLRPISHQHCTLVAGYFVRVHGIFRR